MEFRLKQNGYVIKKIKTMGVQLLILCLSVFSCIDRDRPVDKSKLVGSDYRLFQDTPAWELAKAVQDGNENKIKEILAGDSSLINYQESKYGNTLLMLTVCNQQFKSFRILLENHADVNIHDTYGGCSALIDACSYNRYDIKFVKELLQCGADVNDIEVGERKKWNSTRFTPLMVASREGNLELVKLLISKGADINYQNEYKQSALREATIQERYNVIWFLLQNGVDYKLPISYNEMQDKTYYLVDELRFYMPEIGSSEYKMKMKIVDFLHDRGIEYKDVPIPEYVLKKARERYPNSWQEYLEKY